MINSKNQRFINSELAKYGIYEVKEKVDFSKYTYMNETLEGIDNGKKVINSRDTINIDGDDFFFEKRTLTEDDELFLKLKNISAIEENTKVLRKQEKNIDVIKKIVLFFFVINIIGVALFVFSFVLGISYL